MERSYERIIVPVVGDERDDHALHLAFRLAAKQPHSLTLLYVVPVAQSMPLDAELPAEVMRGETALARAEALAHASAGKATTITSELLQSRSTGAAVVDEAIERRADAIVLTAVITRQHGRDTIGETVHYVLMNAPCQVVVVRLAPPPDARGGHDER